MGSTVNTRSVFQPGGGGSTRGGWGEPRPQLLNH